MQNLNKTDGEIWYQQAFLRDDADELFDSLRASIFWKTERYKMFGKLVESPRKVAWHGDPEACYCYSGVMHMPQPWTRELDLIRQRVEHLTAANFNAVLVNLYRDGHDYMGWHSDNEVTLGSEPVIASVSLGAERLFRLKHKLTGQRREVRLAHGSLLIMSGKLQQYWLHSVPRQLRIKQPRINLTYRLISAPETSYKINKFS